jgi:hypothetical protein
MTLKQVFTVNYIYAFLFGAGFIMLPTFCSELVGFEVAGDAPLIGRVLGIFVLSTGLLTFFARNSAESEARDAIVLTLLTLYGLLILYKVALHTVFGIPPNAVLGMIYVLHIGFVGAYGYFLVKGRRRARPVAGAPGP